MMERPYQVYSPLGSLVLQATEDARYPRDMELRMMDAGFRFFLHGQRLLKKDVNRKQ